MAEAVVRRPGRVQEFLGFRDDRCSVQGREADEYRDAPRPQLRGTAAPAPEPRANDTTGQQPQVGGEGHEVHGFAVLSDCYS